MRAPSVGRGMLRMMRFLLLFWAGFLPLALTDALQDRHGQVQGGVSTLLLSLLLAALLAGISRLTLVPALRRLPALRARAVGADALALASGLAWALASLLLVHTSTALQQILFRRGLLSALPWALLAVPLAFAIARLRPGLHAPRTPVLAGLVLLAFVAVGAVAMRGDARRSAERAVPIALTPEVSVEQRPDVIVIVLDTARADLLGGDFEGQAPMPWLDQYAAGGRNWQRGYSAANRTPPGHAALFTGIYPADCGALPNGHVALGLEQFTLAEQLTTLGWRCAAVVSNERIGSNFGFEQGFEVYDDDLVNDRFLTAVAKRLGRSTLLQAVAGRMSEPILAYSLRQLSRRSQEDVSAADTARRTAEVLDALALRPEEPLMLFVNFIDPHMLYVTRPDLAAEFGPNLAIADLDAARSRPFPFRDRLDELTARISAGEQDEELAQRVRWVRESYYEQSRELDEGLRALIEDLERRGRAGPEDVIFITSDHGEELGHHGEFLHGTTLFEASVRVPFLLRAPGVAAGLEATAPVSSVDFFPTVLTAAGVGSQHWPRGLAGYPLQHPTPPDRVVRFESGGLRGFLRGDRKLIGLDHGDRLEWLHAFDLGADPGEQHNLLGRSAPDWVREFAAAPPFAPSRDALEVISGGFGTPDLDALGYTEQAGPPQ